ncbi:MAG: helix-turn-helix transcriptional regulator [Lachnospiraceae bacterium]
MPRNNLKEARNKAGMTQGQVAEYLGITEQHYQRIEYGTTIGKIALWDKLEDLFNVHQRVLREIHHDKAIHQEIHQE